MEFRSVVKIAFVVDSERIYDTGGGRDKERDFQAGTAEFALEQNFPGIGLINGRQLVDLYVGIGVTFRLISRSGLD